MSDKYIWLYSAIAEFSDAIQEFGVEQVMRELPEHIYQKLELYFEVRDPLC